MPLKRNNVQRLISLISIGCIIVWLVGSILFELDGMIQIFLIIGVFLLLLQFTKKINDLRLKRHLSAKKKCKRLQ